MEGSAHSGPPDRAPSPPPAPSVTPRRAAPGPAPASSPRSRGKSACCPHALTADISAPFEVRHHAHVRYDSDTRTLVGLPPAWSQALAGAAPAPAASDTPLAALAKARDPQRRYAFERVVGEGRSGSVYLAHDRRSGDVVAVKAVVVTAANASRLSDEIRYMRQLHHPNLLRCHRVYMHQNFCWIVMDYASFGALSRVLGPAGVALTEPQIRWVAWCVLQALVYLHSCALMHRDVKSDNVLLDMDGRVRLADFGLVTGSAAHSSAGTTSWMAPEVVRGVAYDVGVDVWSLGVLVLEMAERAPPYSALPEVQALFLISTKGVPRLAAHQWSAPMCDFQAQCCTFKAALRPSSAALCSHAWVQRMSVDSNVSWLVPVLAALAPPPRVRPRSAPRPRDRSAQLRHTHTRTHSDRGPHADPAPPAAAPRTDSE